MDQFADPAPCGRLVARSTRRGAEGSKVMVAVHYACGCHYRYEDDPSQPGVEPSGLSCEGAFISPSSVRVLADLWPPGPVWEGLCDECGGPVFDGVCDGPDCPEDPGENGDVDY